ncbi:MAG: TrmH family RNA methyltransferase [Saprospiraceae bacterium]|nr:TrmH family RNA methyltransferase [Saprospiraceae bacterium]
MDLRKLNVEELNRIDKDSWENAPKIPVIFFLDNVRSALNVGSAFRTADSFSVEKIMLCGITTTPPNREVQKTALGADLTVAWEYYESSVDAVLKLKSEGYVIIAIEQMSKKTYLNDYEIDTNKKFALIFGNEVNGLSEELYPYIDECIEIPQAGTKHSLNVSVCVGILGWEFYKQFKK